MNSNARYRDGTYLHTNPTWHEEDSSWKAGHIVRMLRRHQILPSTIGEIGCGAGEILRCLAAEYGDAVTCVGYEVSPQAYDLAKRKETRNLHFVLEDPLEGRDRAFDVVLVIDVLEHVEDYLGFLRRVRTKGTRTLFHIPLELSVQTVLRASPLSRSRSLVGHLHYFTKETALATLEDAGYEVMDWAYTGGAVDLPSRDWKTGLAKLPRRLLFSLHEDLAARLLGGYSVLVLTR
jgi:cyclopropane fatty-acyl-phospholipid synthase-like methyltransferase